MVLAFHTLKCRDAITHYAVPNTSNYYTTFTTVRLLLFVLSKPLTGSGNAGECIIDATFLVSEGEGGTTDSYLKVLKSNNMVLKMCSSA